METIYQSFQLQDSNSYWTKEENKLFERALAYYDKNTADRWEKVAEMLPGKSVTDVINHYKVLEDDVTDIEAGLFPTPGYHHHHLDFDPPRNKSLRSKSTDLEKKKGVPWTQEEHRKFLMGLLKHGKGDWRSISRNFVITKTSTQVASHAQKYFLRLNSVLKDKRRPSIHDITTTNLTNISSSDVSEISHNLLLDPSFKGFESEYSNLLLKSSGYENMYGIGESGFYNGTHVSTTMFEVQSSRQRIRG